MSRSILIIILISGNSLFLDAQDSLTCGFETLFTIKAGMSKNDVVDLINKNTQATLINTQVEKLPLLNDLSSEEGVSGSGTQAFWSVGFRYNISIGFRF